MSIRVRLEKFEGPLALLLHLIRKDEMDICDIQIHKITTQYLEYIQVMKTLDLEVAGDFVAMAATLIQIKARMLLPQYDENGQTVEEDDPRKELVNRLLEYEKFRNASQRIQERVWLGRDVWKRGMREKWLGTEEDNTIILDEKGLFALIALYRKVMRRVKKNVHIVYAKAQSIASRILEIREFLVPGRRAEFTEFIDAKDAKSTWVITFLSILELSRLGFVSIFQSETYSPIYIDAKKMVDRDVVLNVQEFDAEPVTEEALVRAALETQEQEETGLQATDEELKAAEQSLGIFPDEYLRPLEV